MEENSVLRPNISKIPLNKKEFLINPSIELVGYLLSESKRTIRTTKVRVGRVEGRLNKISTDERVYTYEDNSPFIKVYLDSGALEEYNELSSTAQKMMTEIIKMMKYNEDYVWISNLKFSELLNINESNVSAAKNELLSKEWIFRSTEKFKYWINLCYVCIGDREEIYRKYKNTTR
jgi:hypothetical protein